MSALTDDDLCKNGEFLIDTDPQRWVNQFATLQVMTAEPREDPAHFDGGASLIHMGITLYGQRRMELTTNGDCDSFNLCPGNVYVGNLCAVSHQVFHDEKHGRAEHLNANGDMLKVVVLLRTSLFSAYRRQTAPPTPKVVYDRCNEIVAKHLRDSRLILPSYPGCLAAMKLLRLS